MEPVGPTKSLGLLRDVRLQPQKAFQLYLYMWRLLDSVRTSLRDVDTNAMVLKRPTKYSCYVILKLIS